MVEGLATSLLCSVCSEVCKRGAQMKCCGARACRACAVLKINKNKKCWNEDCGQEDITAKDDLINDDLLRKAVEYFNINGNLTPAHVKVLKKTKDGKGLEKVGELTDKPCRYAENCTSENCIFVHPVQEKKDKKVAKGKKDEKAETKPAAKGHGKTCKYGAVCRKKDVCKFDHPKIKKPCRDGAGCTTKGCKFDHPKIKKPCRDGAGCTTKGCKFDHPKIKKPCRDGAGCTTKGCKFDHPKINKPCRDGAGCSTKGCKFDHSSPNKAPKLRNVRSSRRTASGGMGGGMGRIRESGGGMASMKIRMNDMAMDGDRDDMGGRNTSLAQMQKMKKELETMMSNVMGRTSGGGMGGSGMGGGYGGGSSDRMEGMGGGSDGGMATMKMRMSDMVRDDDWNDMGGRNTSLAQIQKMKEELENMMFNVMGRARGGSGMGGGYGGNLMGRSSDRRGYRGSPERFNF